jgi:hypothetical protein
MTENLPFKVVRSNGHDEVPARVMNLLIARGAYREAARLYPDASIGSDAVPIENSRSERGQFATRSVNAMLAP